MVKKKIVQFEKVCSIMSSLSNIDVDKILSPCRQWPLPVCRGVIYLYYQEKGMTTGQIGKLFNRDHATVLSAAKHIKGWLDCEEPLVVFYSSRFNLECEHQENLLSVE